MGDLKNVRHSWARLEKRLPLEVLLWLLGLAVLALMDPHGEHLLSFCPFSWILESGCPGCGLGHSIGYLARGEWQASWAAHPLAVPAVVLLLWRCGTLLYFQQTHVSSKTLK